MEPVTSSKSVRTTPLATKRGPQCAIAALSKGSDDICSSAEFSVGPLGRLFVATIPRHEAPRRPVHQQFEADAERREQQHADERFVVVVGAGIVEDVVADPADRQKELGNDSTDESPA